MSEQIIFTTKTNKEKRGHTVEQEDIIKRLQVAYNNLRHRDKRYVVKQKLWKL